MARRRSFGYVRKLPSGRREGAITLSAPTLGSLERLAIAADLIATD